MTNMFSEAFADKLDETLPDSPRFLHALAGMITLADWLGSDHTVFLCPDNTIPSGEARIPWARKQAADLIKRRWLDPTRARNAARGLVAEFKILFPDLTRTRPAQEALLSMPLPEPGQTTILEAETGSGKTEAALIHFLRLFQSGQVDGLYFTLPTRAAAVQIHGRIRDMLRRWFGKATPPVGLAVPGYLRVDEDEGQHLPDTYDVLWPDETDRDRTWAVENAKRYLSGAVMVGTLLEQAGLTQLGDAVPQHLDFSPQFVGTLHLPTPIGLWSETRFSASPHIGSMEEPVGAAPNLVSVKDRILVQ